MSGAATPVVAMEFFSAGGRLGGGREAGDGGDPPAGGGDPRAGGRAGPPDGGDPDGGGPGPSDPGTELRREGRRLLGALAEDLARLPDVAPVAVVDAATAADLREDGPAGLEVAVVDGARETAGPDRRRPGATGPRSAPAPAAAAVRAATAREGAHLWPVAPETRGRLEEACRAAEEVGVPLVAPAAGAVGRASRRHGFLRRLDRAGLPVPATASAGTPDHARRRGRELGWPVVVRPGRGAGCAGTTRVDGKAGVAAAWSRAARVDPAVDPIVQPFVEGPAASVLLLCGDGVRPLAFSRQRVRFGPEARYEGGRTPYRHPAAARALEVAAGAARAVPGLHGLVGVDLVLAADGPVVTELNPRLTTSYLGLRRHVGAAAAAGALRAAGRPTGGPEIGPSAGLPLGTADGGARPARFTAGVPR